MSENELMHYGRKGMKWYQHIFGEIDKRAAYASSKLKEASEKRTQQKEAERSIARERALASNKKALRSMSDKDLQDRINRLRLEDEYRKLVLGNTEKTNRGKTAIFNILTSFGTSTAKSYGSVYGADKAKRDNEARAKKQQSRESTKEKAKETRKEIFEGVRKAILGDDDWMKKQLEKGS